MFSQSKSPVPEDDYKAIMKNRDCKKRTGLKKLADRGCILNPERNKKMDIIYFDGEVHGSGWYLGNHMVKNGVNYVFRLDKKPTEEELSSWSTDAGFIPGKKEEGGTYWSNRFNENPVILQRIKDGDLKSYELEIVSPFMFCPSELKGGKLTKKNRNRNLSKSKRKKTYKRWC